MSPSLHSQSQTVNNSSFTSHWCSNIAWDMERREWGEKNNQLNLPQLKVSGLSSQKKKTLSHPQLIHCSFKMETLHPTGWERHCSAFLLTSASCSAKSTVAVTWWRRTGGLPTPCTVLCIFRALFCSPFCTPDIITVTEWHKWSHDFFSV